MNAGKRKERNPVQKKRVEKLLRDRIISGEWKPGGKLPPRSILTESLDTSTLTLQEAIDNLTADGWLVSRSRISTCVAEQPPHLNRFALLVLPEEEQELRDHAVIEAARRLTLKHGWQIDIVPILNIREPDNQDQELFLERLESEYYGCVILSTVTFYFKEVMKEMRYPLTGFFAGKDIVFPEFHFPAEYINEENIYKQAIRNLSDRGSRRIGFFGTFTVPCREIREQILSGAEECGLTVSPGMIQQVHHGMGRNEFSKELFRLMFDPANPDHADGLILNNENVLPVLEEVLHECYGNQAYQAVKIVSIGNLPILPETKLDVRFFGYDMVQTLETFIQDMTEYRLTGKIPHPCISKFCYFNH